MKKEIRKNQSKIKVVFTVDEGENRGYGFGGWAWMTYGGGFVCCDKTEHVSTLLLGLGDLVAVKGCCYCLFGCFFYAFAFLLGSGFILYGGC